MEKSILYKVIDIGIWPDGNKLDIADLPELKEMHQVISMDDSDSYTLDNMLEYLLME